MEETEQNGKKVGFCIVFTIFFVALWLALWAIFSHYWESWLALGIASLIMSGVCFVIFISSQVSSGTEAPEGILKDLNQRLGEIGDERERCAAETRKRIKLAKSLSLYALTWEVTIAIQSKEGVLCFYKDRSLELLDEVGSNKLSLREAIRTLKEDHQDLLSRIMDATVKEDVQIEVRDD